MITLYIISGIILGLLFGAAGREAFIANKYKHKIYNKVIKGKPILIEGFKYVPARKRDENGRYV